MTPVAGQLLNMVLGAGILFAVFAAWLGVQHWARKADHLPADCDMLNRPEHGCGHCQLRDKCSRATEDGHGPKK